MVMEVLTCIIKRRVQATDDFSYHKHCSKLDLVNLCFADDLFLFAHGDVHSAKVLMESLDEFKLASGLVPSLTKSTAFFCNVLNITKLAILNILPFEEGCLPVKYLGVPLVSSRLGIRHCNELIQMIDHRINDWKNKSLSSGGRLQLINSVLGSMNVYWSSMFLLPNSVINTIEQMMRTFLWGCNKVGRSASKVAWDVVCYPKNEGGLGIRRLATFNKALIMVHIWNLLSLKESLWVRWIHAYKIKNRNFWDIPARGNMTWSWRKILLLRPIIRKFIWFKIGDGLRVSLWFDNWCPISPLDSVISARDRYLADLSPTSTVNEVLLLDKVVWPNDLLSRYPDLSLVSEPCYRGSMDQVEWRDRHGVLQPFSVREAWQAIRPRGNKVDWYRVIWFTNCIPRHAFNLWLVIKQKLKTQDLIQSWDVSDSLGVNCSLCDVHPDSHAHLFFECSYAKQVWSRVNRFSGLPLIQPSIAAIIATILPFANRRTTTSVIAKLTVAATAYFIWQERNQRLFKKQKRPVDQLVDCILNSVRLKLMSCRFKRSTAGTAAMKSWGIPSTAVF